MSSTAFVLLASWVISSFGGTTEVPPSWIAGYSHASFLYSTSSKPAGNPQVGNGYVATFVGTTTEYVSGVFNGVGTVTPSHRASIPALTNIDIQDSSSHTLTPTAWGMDLQHAISYRLFSSGDCNIQQSWYAHQTERHAIITTFIFNNTGSQALAFSLKNNAGSKSKDLKIESSVNNSTVYGFLYSTIEPEEKTTPLTKLCVASTPYSKITVNGNSIKTVVLVSVRYTSLVNDHTDTSAAGGLFSVCTQNLQRLEKMNPTTLQTQHTQAWDKLWQAGIAIDGDMELARTVNASAYALLCGLRADWPYSSSPGGLPTDGYNGHTFWDVETWMYPSIALLWPHIAKGSIIQYRYLRIPGAKKKAANNHYNGTMYPWESAFTGQEVCPAWAPTGKYEQHITGDVALALWQYYSLSEDKQWLQQVGYEMFSLIADFWVSRVSGNQQDGYSINDVIPPDEFHNHVNNSVYTNVVAKLSLEFAVQSAKILGKPVPSQWTVVRDHLIILFNKTLQIHPEFQGFLRLPRKNREIKQADVVLLPYPLQYPSTNAVTLSDLKYYAPLTSPSGPAMTWGMFAIGYLSIGDNKNGQMYFSKAYQQYIQKPFYEWWEVKAGSGTANFLTGAGGFLQSLYAGWMGLRISLGSITLDPPTELPTGTSGITLRSVEFLGNKIAVHYRGSEFGVQILQKGTTDIVACQDGKVVPLPLTQRVPLTAPIRLVKQGDCN